jgi:eukaryotic-like serine/threonine-protein kinase
MSSGAPDPSGLSGRIISHFRVLEPLGAGGMGVVYRAEDVTLGRTVALKFMRPDYTIDDAAEARFLREARSVAALDHLNICTVHEAGTSADGLLYLAMSYYRGETLKDYLTSSGALPVGQALDIAGQIARGLACAHAAGIIHRDLKPANVMLTPDGTVKILDFGLAKTRDQTMTASGVLMGTVAYMSPEQLVGAPADARSDLWSLGVMLVEMVTGRHPSTVDNSSTLAHQVEAASRDIMGSRSTAALVRLVERLMRRDPDERYQSATELAHDISALAQQSSAGAATARFAGVPVKRVA